MCCSVHDVRLAKLWVLHALCWRSSTMSGDCLGSICTRS